MDEALATSNFRGPLKGNSITQSPDEGGNVETDRMTEPPAIFFFNSCTPQVGGTAPTVAPRAVPAYHNIAVCPAEADESCGSTNTGRRVYALRPRKAHKPRQESFFESIPRGRRPNIPVAGRCSSGLQLVAEFEDIGDDHQALEKLTHPDESEEETENTEESESPRQYRKTSTKFAGRVTANPLRNLAATFRSKLSHGGYCNLLKLATEIHLEAKEKHNTAMRRIYDVVNVTEAAGCLERSIVSRSGKKMKQCSKGSSLTGSLIRWCDYKKSGESNPKPEEKLTSKLENLKLKLSNKAEELRSLETEVEVLENLTRYRKMKAAFAECFPTSTLSHTTEAKKRCMEGVPNQPHASPTQHGITVPFCLLKASRESDDGNFEISTYTDGGGQEFQVVFSSAHEIQPYGWGSFVREIVKIPK